MLRHCSNHFLTILHTTNAQSVYLDATSSLPANKLSSSDLFVFLENTFVVTGHTISCLAIVAQIRSLIFLDLSYCLLPPCVCPTSREQYQLIRSFTEFLNSLLRLYWFSVLQKWKLQMPYSHRMFARVFISWLYSPHKAYSFF